MYSVQVCRDRDIDGLVHFIKLTFLLFVFLLFIVFFYIYLFVCLFS